MFGFLHASGDRAYRQVYAAACRDQRRHYGIGSLLFHSYEAVFLRLFAIDAGRAPAPEINSPNCCRLQRGPLPTANPDIGRFCSSFALLLASIKLEDDIQDERSIVAWLSRWWLRDRFRKVRSYFRSQDDRFDERLAEVLDRHAKLERSGFVELAEYTEPTASGFAYLFRMFGRLLVDEPQAAEEHADRLESIGRAIGGALLAFDCVVDEPADRRRGRFNPVRDPREAIEFVGRNLSQAGWICSDLFGPDARTVSVLRTNFASISQRARMTPRPVRWPIRRALRWGLPRNGVCDCACDVACCEGCCELCCHGCGECCVNRCCGPMCENKKRSSEQDSKSTASPVKSSTGEIGRTLGPLSPTGVIQLGENRVPARAERGFIPDGAEVVVVGEKGFGVVVRELGASKPDA